MATRPVNTAVRDLVLDRTVHPREAIDDAHVRALADAIRMKAKLPVVVADRQSRRVVDGFHRCSAYRVVYGGEVKVSVEFRDYANEAELFAAAIALNANHGRKLAGQDHSRIIIRARQLGLSLDRVSELLHVPADRLERRTLVGKPAATSADAQSSIPLKRTLAPLNGRALTDAQIEANRKAGGMPAAFYVRQISMLLEADALDLRDRRLVLELRRLRDLLDSLALPEAASGATART
jgi:hypothetical protein